ncbi:sigma-E factor negative regulatory protein [Crenobacter cavernae]|uniref:Anti-sigma 24 factor n=1 Tax=Crenobacter cavernae TaxID=2290923 RepID=A0ABY0FHI2_9NEIS|nr:sigma-E factor negative regulatory protein [Crenobacter cavernae]RXZ44278.1 anti-sigma 24 factor [Crenobacter cavernae]
MKESVSALMDGEIDEQEAARTLNALGQDPDLKASWDEYHLIGDALRNNALLSVSVAPAVSRQVESEPTVLAPRQRRSFHSGKIATWALAASVSFAAVVAWQQFGRDPGLSTAPTVALAVPTPTMSARDDSYLTAHQEIATDPVVVKAALQSEVRH